jgi:hypothetical protein
MVNKLIGYKKKEDSRCAISLEGSTKVAPLEIRRLQNEALTGCKLCHQSTKFACPRSINKL